MTLTTQLLILAAASFAAAFLSASFSVGGGYILFGASTWILPLPSAIALQSALSFGSLLSRTQAFWADIDWPIVRSFTAGSLFGVGGGMVLYSRASESLLAICVALLLWALAWAPPLRSGGIRLRTFFSIGVVHAVVGTVFGLGAILQPALLRTQLARTAIVGTFATCIILLEVLRTGGYASNGFAYADYWPHIAIGTITGLAGTYAGKRFSPGIGENAFRFVMKMFVTALGARFFYRGITA